jgi:hypothetical protein
MSNHTEAPATCIHGPACERIHVGHAVKIVLDEGQLGYGSTGVVIATDRYNNCVVRFDAPVTYAYGGDTSTYTQLSYGEAELEKVAA